MNPTQQVIGIARLGLRQRRFRNGALYLSVVTNDDNSVDAIDCRFFLEEGMHLTPTRKGFRVRTGDFPKLQKLLKLPCNDIGEHIIWDYANRKLIVRRCDDIYGKGVDVRYYRNSPDYQGWERRGIRFKDEDFISLGKLLDASRPFSFDIAKASNLFAGKIIITSQFPQRGSIRAAPGSSEGFDGTPVAEALRTFLAED